MTVPPPSDIADLLTFLDASPSPFHAVASTVARLAAAGFSAVDEREPWPATGRHYVVRGGSLVAWALDHPDQLDHGFRLVGAHTDSPNLRIKPRPDIVRAGYRQLGVEVYGGALWNSWLDRDLGLSGRVTVQADGAPGEPASMTTQLVRIERPLLRIPQLAIHLDRGVNEAGLKLNPQQHLVPVWGLDHEHGHSAHNAFVDVLAEELAVGAADILAWDIMAHDLTPAAMLGRRSELLSSARLDNLLSCWAAQEAIVRATAGAGAPSCVPVICLFDHEEIGSESATGASGSLLPTILERVTLAAGRGREDWLRTLAHSRCVSADGAHATHPNYAERHEPNHFITPNAGPVIKTNTNVRYATDAEGAGWFKIVCDFEDVPTQDFVVRTDMACGSTIGPITAARLGISTVDVGVAQLSMHSARELCGAADPAYFARALTAFFRTD